MVNFASLVNWFAGVFYQGDNFYQIIYTFLMILQPSDAQNSSFLQFFYSFKKYTQKVLPSAPGTSVRKG
jgi:hypothetical protein